MDALTHAVEAYAPLARIRSPTLTRWEAFGNQ